MADHLDPSRAGYISVLAERVEGLMTEVRDLASEGNTHRIRVEDRLGRIEQEVVAIRTKLDVRLEGIDQQRLEDNKAAVRQRKEDISRHNTWLTAVGGVLAAAIMALASWMMVR